MKELKLSPKAEEDLENIYIYTLEKWGISQADKYQDSLYSGFSSLLKHPKMGREYEHRSGYRRIGVGKHIAFYQDTPRAIVITRILHERMDVDSISE